jgi:hypothetical protein
MANKKRTQNKRNKRSGKKQRRRTAAKQRGGGITYEIKVLSPTLEEEIQSYTNKVEWEKDIAAYKLYQYDVSKPSETGSKYSVTVRAPGI